MHQEDWAGVQAIGETAGKPGFRTQVTLPDPSL